MNVNVLTPSGERSGEIVLDDAIFAAKVNVPLMHQVVVAQLAAARAGTHSTKTRGEVRGGGAKPWRQKGTGRARHGSTREPQWKGGGIVFGPRSRDHSLDVPKKMKALALRSAVSARAGEGRLVVIDGLSFEKPKTKEAVAALKNWNVEGKVLVVLMSDDVNVAFAFRNLTSVHVIEEHQLNVYDVLNADWLVFVRSALEAFQSRLLGTAPKGPQETQPQETQPRETQPDESPPAGGVREAAGPSPATPERSEGANGSARERAGAGEMSEPPQSEGHQP
jgi:large subunit ribosomal protein L4